MSEKHVPDSQNNDISDKISERRLGIANLSNVVLGGLAYLNDTHVYNSEDYSGSQADFTAFSKRSEKVFSLARTIIGKYFIVEKHIQGTWPGYIHYMPNFTNSLLKPLFIVTDYNLFTTASTAYSLLLFDDRSLPGNFQPVSAMLNNANQVISGHKRGDAFNFWITRCESQKAYNYSAPLNIPVWLVNLRWNIHKYTGLLGLKKFHESELLADWIRTCYDFKNNPSGSTAVFNIPNDADNTSIAVSFQFLYNKKINRTLHEEDVLPLEKLCLFRDIKRAKADRHNIPTGRETGAFLTWLKDEEMPVFSNPGEGIIPLSVNNVDIVINANVLFALSLTNKESLPGFRDTINLISRIIESREWAYASLYYPQKMIFPYVISRAWRDAGICEPSLELSLQNLMVQILEEQSLFEKNHPNFPGVFPDGENGDNVFSTALGLVSLLNLGQSMAKKCGLLNQYNYVVENAVLFLIRNCHKSRIRQKNTHQQFPGITPIYWKSGILFSSSMKQLAHWRSHAQVTSLVLEALAKYILAYDIERSTFLSCRLYLNENRGNLYLSLHPLK